jgi:hypothetical protein
MLKRIRLDYALRFYLLRFLVAAFFFLAAGLFLAAGRLFLGAALLAAARLGAAFLPLPVKAL